MMHNEKKENRVETTVTLCGAHKNAIENQLEDLNVYELEIVYGATCCINIKTWIQIYEEANNNNNKKAISRVSAR